MHTITFNIALKNCGAYNFLSTFEICIYWAELTLISVPEKAHSAYFITIVGRPYSMDDFGSNKIL
jgi:hypothetical protein